MEDLKNQKHYTIDFKGKITNTKEIIDSILLNLKLDGKEGFNIGNVLKYVIRYKHKNGVEDLKKARNFLDYEIGDNPQEIIKTLEEEINNVVDDNIKMEMEIERLKNKIHNTNIDFKITKDVLEETKGLLEKAVNERNNLRHEKNEKKEKLLKEEDTKDLVEELITRKGVHKTTPQLFNVYDSDIISLNIHTKTAFRNYESDRHAIDAYIMSVLKGDDVFEKIEECIKKIEVPKGCIVSFKIVNDEN